MTIPVAMIAVFAFATSVQAQSPSWPAAFYDPAADTGAPADLVLPMPCGAAMAFQRVEVPVERGDPLSDMRVRIGQSDPETGYSDYLRTAFLRGPFTTPDTGDSYFYIARYELTRGQHRVLAGDCAPPEGPDRLAQGGLSWFEAVSLSRDYSEWMLVNTPANLPADGDRRAYARLPTEVEWEFAARGGTRIDPAQYPARRFFQDGTMDDFALFNDGRRKEPGPVGIRAPNPLGLFDVYGNAEELMLEPYRLNALGRSHGQVGGLVTRGGALDAAEPQIYSAQRTEYPMFDAASGSAMAGDYFGLRLVLSANAVSGDRIDAIHDSWIAQADSSTTTSGDALTQLASILQSEVDPARQAALSGVQLQFRRAKEEARLAQDESARATLLSNATIVDALRRDAGEIERLQRLSSDIARRVPGARDKERDALMSALRNTAASITDLRDAQNAYLLVLRTAFDTISTDMAAEDLRTIRDGLTTRLETAGQTTIARKVDAAWGVLQTYGQEADMEQAALLDLVLRR